ncbi:hypothetical protein TRVA0_015S01816 [Trichomonascus vanleenenianus]|uniref:Axl2p n=1 Tax=Trichomonascus vanleenenianus TaxID=2268995 RepID=UPI003ECA3E0F
MMKRQLLALAAFFAAQASIGSATPSINYPFNNQSPPVARYNENYTYQIPFDTFSSSDPSNLVYSVNSSPAWLSFDSSSRTLSGAPPQGGADSTVYFNLVATDSTGSSSSNCTLVVTDSPAPQLQSSSSLASVLSSVGPTAGDAGLVLTAGQQFTIQFPSNFYTEPQGSSKQIIGYYAYQDTHTPLPIWLNFNADAMQFTGTAPTINSNIAPAQEFGVCLSVSDVSGFSSNEVVFHLIVGAHQFTSNLTIDGINATVGRQFTYQIPFDKMSLDGTSVQRANLSSIAVNNTNSGDWLQLNSSTGVLSGTPPTAGQQVFSVSVSDEYSDLIEYLLAIDVQAAADARNANATIFTSETLGVVNATRGTFFQYSLEDKLLVGNSTNNKKKRDTSDNKDLEISASYNLDWLAYHSSNYSFTGWVPQNYSKSETVTLSGHIGDGPTQSASFTLAGVAPSKSSPSSMAESSGVTSTRTIAIVCGTVIPVCVLGAIAVLFFCCRTRSKSKTQREKTISPPILPGGYDEEKGSINMAPTVVGDSDKDSGILPWDSPHKVLARNFIKMDSSVEDFPYYHSGEETQVESVRSLGTPSTLKTPLNQSVERFGSPALIPATQFPAQRKVQPQQSQHLAPPDGANNSQTDLSTTAPRARNSWRQSNETEARWQEHKSVGSLATISTDELLTMRLVDRQSGSRDTFMEPTQPRLLSYVQADESGNFQTLGSHSSSLNTVPQAITTNDEPGLDSVAEERYTPDGRRRTLDFAPTTFSSDDEDAHRLHSRNTNSGADVYNTASSGSSFISEDEEEIMPRRNSRGELTLSQISLRQQMNELVASSEDYFDFNTGSGQTAPATPYSERRNTVRLVGTPERKPSQAASPTSVTHRDSQLPHSSSAEIAFL